LRGFREILALATSAPEAAVLSSRKPCGKRRREVWLAERRLTAYLALKELSVAKWVRRGSRRDLGPGT